MYMEARGDIFRIEQEAIAHCITADYSLGAGLAKELDKVYDLRSKLMNCGSFHYPECIAVKEGDLTIFNLATKDNRYSKPTYEDLEKCIAEMKQQMIDKGIEIVYIPQLGCGKDRLKWEKVKPILKKYFDKDKKVDVCVLFYVPPKK